MQFGFDMTVQRRHAAGAAKMLLQEIERGAAREAEHKVEIDQAAATDIGQLLAPHHPTEHHRRVQIVEDVQRRRVQHQIAGFDTVGQ